MSPHARRLMTALGGLAAAGALVVPTSQGIAHATVTSYGSIPESVLSGKMATTAGAAEKVEEYWKPDRLKRADDSTPKTADPKVSSPSSASAGEAAAKAMSGLPTTASNAGPARAGGSSGTARVLPWTVAPAAPAKSGVTSVRPATVGKVYFRSGGKDYWCSASAVRAKNRSLVATAAHCAFDLRTNEPMENWIFVPAYRQGSHEAGIYVGHTVALDIKYSQGDYDYDYAFVTVHRGFKWQQGKDAKGQPTFRRVDMGLLQDNVGGQGITTGRPVAVNATAFGYPGGPQPDGSKPYNGHTLKTCSGLTSAVKSPTYQLEHGIAIKDCDFTAGASGGPWLASYSASRGAGLLVGINSLSWNRKVDGKNDHISSSYFGPHVRAVYGYVAGLKTG
ncbi:trypsin-like serine peptidase [Spongiactinospora sp. 9N601]|uniref:trypsin-like serine peptidase n=1 Tax=Spongiactinospora sp. 9N601 TaxID=3375149 RepID=UPI0037A6F1BE